MSITQKKATTQDEHLQWLRGYIIAGRPEIKDQVQQDIWMYWSFRDDMAVIDGIILKGRHIIIPEIQKAQVLDQLHINYMGWKNRTPGMWIYLFGQHEWLYWKCHKNNTTCLTSQQTQSKDKMIHHDIPVRPWDVIGADMFTLNNKHYLCIVDYHSKFPIIKKAEDLSADSLILTWKLFLQSAGYQRK